MAFIENVSEYEFENYQATLANGAEIDSGWIDMEKVDKYQFEGICDEDGMDLVIESSNISGGGEADVTSTTNISTTYHLFNVIARQRWIRFRWQNNKGVGVTGAFMGIKLSYGSSDKLSVFPVGVNPSDFSQAALVQSVVRGKQPDGDYVAVPADGTAYSTDANLGISGTVTSGWMDTDGWSDIQVFITSDVPSASRGVLVEYTGDANAVTPATKASHFYSFTQEDINRGFLRLNLEPLLDGVKVTYTNGLVAQTDFCLDISLRVSSQPHNRNPAGALMVGDFNTEVALGDVPNYTIDTKFGRNPVINIGTPEDMWNGGSVYTGHPVSFTPETVDVYSDDAADTSAGTGARTMRIWGLKSNTSEIYETEDIILNGTTAVTSVNTWWRVNKAIILTAGSGEENAGTITVEPTTTSANVFVQMPAGFNATTIGAYTVPYGKKMLIKRIRVALIRSSGSAGSGTITLRARPTGGVYNARRVFGLQTGAATEFTELGGMVFTAGTDIKYRIDDVSDNATEAEGSFEYLLIETEI